MRARLNGSIPNNLPMPGQQNKWSIHCLIQGSTPQAMHVLDFGTGALQWGVHRPSGKHVWEVFPRAQHGARARMSRETLLNVSILVAQKTWSRYSTPMGSMMKSLYGIVCHMVLLSSMIMIADLSLDAQRCCGDDAISSLPGRAWTASEFAWRAGCRALLVCSVIGAC